MQKDQEQIRLLKDIAAFVKKQTTKTFFRSLLSKEDMIVAIEGYHRKLESAVNAFQVGLQS